MTEPFEPTTDCPIPEFERFTVTRLIDDCELLPPPSPLYESDLFDYPLPMLPLLGFGCNCPTVAGTIYYAEDCDCSSWSSNSSESACPCVVWDEAAYWNYVDAGNNDPIDWQASPTPPPTTQSAYRTAMAGFIQGNSYRARIADNWNPYYGVDVPSLLGIPTDQWANSNALSQITDLSEDRNLKGRWIVPATATQPARWGYWLARGASTIFWEHEDSGSPETSNHPVMKTSVDCNPDDPCDITIHLELWLPDNLQGPPGPKTAIVGVENDSGEKEYVGLFCIEAPEVKFVDVLRDIRISNSDRIEVRLDPLFVQVCEPDTIRPVSVLCDKPVACGAKMVAADRVLVILDTVVASANIILTVEGIRKGMRHLRFPKFTEAQKRRNDEFWASAHRS